MKTQMDTPETSKCQQLIAFLFQMMEKGHRTGRVAEHQCCHGGTWYVMLEEEEMQKTLGKCEPARLGFRQQLVTSHL